MDKVLVLGSKGLLGSEIVRVFSDTEVIAWDLEDLDVVNAELTREKIVNLSPTIIINTTANNAVDKIESEAAVFKEAKILNTETIKTLAQLSAEIGSIFVHYSSDYVFDGTNRSGYSENEKTNPINKYGLTKAAGEKFLIESEAKFYLIRLSRLFGKPGSSKNSKTSFVDYIVGAGRISKEIRLVNDEVSCPTFSKDLARFTKNLIVDRAPFGVYHGANSGACSWYDFGKEIIRISKLKTVLAPIRSVELNRAAKRPLFSELLNTKRPKQPHWLDALERYLK